MYFQLVPFFVPLSFITSASNQIHNLLFSSLFFFPRSIHRRSFKHLQHSQQLGTRKSKRNDEVADSTNEKTQNKRKLSRDKQYFVMLKRFFELLCNTMHFINSIDNHGMLTECFCCSYSIGYIHQMCIIVVWSSFE